MVIVRRLVTTAIFVTFLVMPFLAAKAREGINVYQVKVVVEDNGDIDVTEQIDITAERYNIKHGIYRDLPLYRRTALGGILPIHPQIVSVKRDGKPEPYRLTTIDMGQRIYIGSPSVFLTAGERYSYEIRYKVPDQVFFYDDYDELYWNVIGTGWVFPIAKASGEIVLPGNAPVSDYRIYSGKTLSAESGPATVTTGAGTLKLALERSLAPHEGVTVALSWPQGYVARAPYMSGLTFFSRQHPGLYLMLFTLLLTAGYYYVAWNKVGRDPKKRALTPFYNPPDGISPAVAAYIAAMGAVEDNQLLTATIMSLAAKGYIEIEDKDEEGVYEFRRLPDSSHVRPPITEEERIIYDAIGDSLIVGGDNNTKLMYPSIKHRLSIELKCGRRYFKTNALAYSGGIVPLTLGLPILWAKENLPNEPFGTGIALIACFGALSFALVSAALARLRGNEKAYGAFTLFIGLFMSAAVFLGIFLLGALTSWLVTGCIVLLFAIVFIMYFLMKAATPEGRELMDRIEGLRYYMETVEEKILQKFDPPQMSRELYEKYLPYAVALGVESKWAEKFMQATASTLADTKPRWYSGTNATTSYGGFSASAMTSSFSSAIGAASGSASSGGGSVGGGGGGGGGGGW